MYFTYLLDLPQKKLHKIKVGYTSRLMKRFREIAKYFGGEPEVLDCKRFNTKREAQNYEDLMRIALRNDENFNYIPHDCFEYEYKNRPKIPTPVPDSLQYEVYYI